MRGEWQPAGFNVKEEFKNYMEHFLSSDEGRQFLKEVVWKNTETMKFVTEIPEEATVVIRSGKDEWWMEPSHCKKCENDFMAPGAKYCPYCRRKIVGISDGLRTIYDFSEEEEKEE